MSTMIQVLVLAATVAQPQNTQSTPAGNPANGEALFASKGCYACHGYVGHGGAAPRLTPPWPLAAFANYIRVGGQNRSVNARAMPAYSTVNLSDAEIADIHAYLSSLPPPSPVKSIPLLND